MEFTDIGRVLKRYSFEAKMAIAHGHSKDIMSSHGILEVNELQKKVYPWEIEVFTLFSILTTNEYQYRDFDGKGIREFYNIINCLRTYTHPKLEELKGDVSFVDCLLVMTGLTQFQVQEPIFYKLYRYSYFFSYISEKINMQQHFENTYGCPYNDFKNAAFATQLLLSSEYDSNILINYLIKKKYPKVFSNLVISRTDFVKKQKEITDNIDDYYYCFKYFNQYPLIEEKGTVYMPLPHLIVQSCTNSLLYRMTQANPHSRELFGKEVLESYIYKIFCGADDYDEVKSEYAYGTPERRTADVMIRNSHYCLLIESKSMVPSTKVRIYNQEEIEKIIDRTALAVIQLYHNIVDRFQVEYYPFDVNIKFEPDNIYGIVALLEDHYIRRDLIYKRVAEKLKLDNESIEYRYICSNVKILSLYEIESKVFESHNIISLLIDSKNSPQKWFNYTLDISADEKKSISVMSVFIENETNNIINLAEEMLQAGVIS